MDGVFCNKKWTLTGNILGLVSGIMLAVFLSSVLIFDGEGSLSAILATYFFIGFAIFISILCGVSLYVNKRVFLHADEQTVMGYFHFGLAIQCRISDIDAITYGGTGLTLQLKNGKKYNMHNLENAIEMGMYIKRRIPLPPAATVPMETLIEEVRSMDRKRRRDGLGLVACLLLDFGSIFLTAWLTDGKELDQFAPADWQIFGIMAGIGLILALGIVILIRRLARHSDAFYRTQAALYLLIFRTAPLPPGNGLKVYIGVGNDDPIRVTVCGFPGSDGVYHIVEQIGGDYRLETIHESSIYPNLDALLPELESLRELPMTD